MSPRPAVNLTKTSTAAFKTEPPKLSVISYNACVANEAPIMSDVELGSHSETELSDSVAPGASGNCKNGGKKKNKLLNEKPTPQVPKATQRRNPKLSDYSRKDDREGEDGLGEDNKAGGGRNAGRGRGRGRFTLPKPGESTASVAGYPPAPVLPKASKVRQRASTMSTVSTASTASTRIRGKTASKLQNEFQEFEDLSRENAFPGISEVVTSTTDSEMPTSSYTRPQAYGLREIDEVEVGEEEENNGTNVDTADWRDIDLNLDDSERNEIVPKKPKKSVWQLCDCFGFTVRIERKPKPAAE